MVKETFYFEGDRVRKGDRLALIFSRDLLSAQSDYLLILKRYKRAMLKEDEDKILMEKMLNSSKLRLEMLGLDEEVIEKIKISEEASPFHYIKAPIEGTVIESNAITGVQFQEGSVLFKIADVKSLWIQVNIYEKDLFGLKNGLKAEVWVPSNPEKKFKGILKVIGEVLDKETRTLKGRIEVTDRTENLKPGMFVEAAIYKNKNEKILSVSDKAIRKMEGKDVVFVVKGENEFAIRQVKPGRTFGELREIIHGLEEGEIVVSEGSFVLKSHAMSGKMDVD
ncbi:MAG: efflux RND transporter periplasmic adaptor subunit [Candidatus Aminicenantia bacterium]